MVEQPLLQNESLPIVGFLVLLDLEYLHILKVGNGQGSIMDLTIMVHLHDGPMGFGDIPRCFLNCLKSNILSGLLMVLDRRQFYGNAWKYRQQGLRFGGVCQFMGIYGCIKCFLLAFLFSRGDLIVWCY